MNGQIVFLDGEEARLIEPQPGRRYPMCRVVTKTRAASFSLATAAKALANGCRFTTTNDRRWATVSR